MTKLLMAAWILVVGVWILNHFHRENLKYEQDYKNGKRPKW